MNRLDTIQVFNKLSFEAVVDVVRLRIRDLEGRLRERRIVLDLGEAEGELGEGGGEGRGVVETLARKGYSDVYGARAIEREVKRMVVFPLAGKMLRGSVRFVLIDLVIMPCWSMSF